MKILLNLIFFVLAVVSYLHNSHYVTLTHTHTHVQTLRRWVGKSSHTTNRSRTLWPTAYFAADYTNTFRFRDIHGLLHTPQLSTHNTQLPFASLLRRLCGSADFHPQLRSHSSPLLTTHPTNTTTPPTASPWFRSAVYLPFLLLLLLPPPPSVGLSFAAHTRSPWQTRHDTTRTAIRMKLTAVTRVELPTTNAASVSER